MQHARLIAFPPDGAAVIRPLEPNARLRVGRSAECGLMVEHASISRAHAELAGGPDGWRLRDLGSKNGTFVDGHRAAEQLLDKACWIRFGDVHCEFILLDEAQADAAAGRQHTLRAQSQALIRRLVPKAHFGALLDDILRGVLELSGCTRGFVLVADAGDYVVFASKTLDPSALRSRSFQGSVGAVQRVLSERRPIAVNRVDGEPWLADRASVVAMGLQCLVCLPLLDGDRVLGAVYADRAEVGAPITQLDLEILAAFAESAAVWVLAGQAIEILDNAPRWHTIVSAHGQGDSAV